MGFININYQQIHTTIVSNDFIKNYMPKANPNLVKIYLYMLMLSNSHEPISIEDIANTFDIFESDVIKALTLLSKDGFCSFVKSNDDFFLSFDTKKSSSTKESKRSNSIQDALLIDEEKIELENVANYSKKQTSDSLKLDTPVIDFTITNDARNSNDITIPLTEAVQRENQENTIKYSPSELEFYLQTNKEIEELVSFIENMYGNIFTPANLEALINICDAEYGNPRNLKVLITYIFENRSVTKIGPLLKTLETLAINMHEKGINTSEDIVNYLNRSSRDYMQIFNHLGICGRVASDIEKRIMDKWLYELKIPLQLILEACDRAMLATKDPNLKYIEKILLNWQSSNITTLEDLRLFNERNMQKGYFAANKQQENTRPKSKFVNYDQTQIDYTQFENLDMSRLGGKYGR